MTAGCPNLPAGTGGVSTSYAECGHTTPSILEHIGDQMKLAGNAAFRDGQFQGGSCQAFSSRIHR